MHGQIYYYYLFSFHMADMKDGRALILFCLVNFDKYLNILHYDIEAVFPDQ